MIRKPIFTFDTTADLWVDKIPLNSNVQVTDDSNPANGSGSAKFINVHDISGLGPTTTIQDLLDLPAQWTEIGVPERGGIAWDATTNYSKGDMVINLSDFATYKCNMNNNIGHVPSSALSGWDRAIPDERGGLRWSTTLEYSRGDIVYDVIDDTPYVAIVATVADQTTIPSQNLLEWKAITGTSGSMLTADYRFSDLVAGDPGTGSCSCNNADNTLADVLFINILDEDNIDRTYGLEALTLGDYVNYRDKGNDPDTYIYRVTGVGINHGTYFEVPVVHHTSVGAGGLANNERMNIEVLYIPSAHEKGGVAWSTNFDYKIGDVVTIDGEAHICNTDHTPLTGDVIAGDPTQLAQMYWDPIFAISDIATLDYLWRIPPEVAPAITYCSVAPDILTATTIYMNKDSLTGDVSADIELIENTDEITIFAVADNTNFVKYTVTGDPVLVGNVYEIPATFLSQGGVIADDEPVTFTIKSISKGCICGYVAETGTATYTPDFAVNNFFDYTMTQNSTFTIPDDVKPGDTGTIVVRQDAIGGWLATWAPNYQWPEGLPILDDTADWVHIFEYNCISTVHVVMEYISDFELMPVVPTPPRAITDFDATDTLYGEIIVTWSNSIGLPTPTYDLYDGTSGLLVSGITSPYTHAFTGTETYHVKAVNAEGSVDSNLETGTGLAVTTLVAITDFAASDTNIGYVEVTFTEQ